MKEYSVAPIYDFVLFPFVRRVRRGILEVCLEHGYRTVLDVCCGTGDQLKMLRKHGFEVSGVDLSEEMLQVSRRGSYAPVCRLEDASRMSFQDDSFDAAMTTFALHEKEEETARAIIEEMVRVVKPGGHVILSDFVFDEATSGLSRTIVTAIERFAGGEHYRNFRGYTERGGIPSLTGNFPLEPLESNRVGMGSVVISLYRLNT